ncbi:hypothetical protein MRB53_039722 [Persea americana]|nr:hypothetical protein MRB53_039722 [Persea americana]
MVATTKNRVVEIRSDRRHRATTTGIDFLRTLELRRRLLSDALLMAALLALDARDWNQSSDTISCGVSLFERIRSLSVKCEARHCQQSTSQMSLPHPSRHAHAKSQLTDPANMSIGQWASASIAKLLGHRADERSPVLRAPVLPSLRILRTDALDSLSQEASHAGSSPIEKVSIAKPLEDDSNPGLDSRIPLVSSGTAERSLLSTLLVPVETRVRSEPTDYKSHVPAVSLALVENVERALRRRSDALLQPGLEPSQTDAEPQQTQDEGHRGLHDAATLASFTSPRLSDDGASPQDPQGTSYEPSSVASVKSASTPSKQLSQELEDAMRVDKEFEMRQYARIRALAAAYKAQGRLPSHSENEDEEQSVAGAGGIAKSTAVPIGPRAWLEEQARYSVGKPVIYQHRARQSPVVAIEQHHVEIRSDTNIQTADDRHPDIAQGTNVFALSGQGLLPSIEAEGAIIRVQAEKHAEHEEEVQQWLESTGFYNEGYRRRTLQRQQSHMELQKRKLAIEEEQLRDGKTAGSGGRSVAEFPLLVNDEAMRYTSNAAKIESLQQLSRRLELENALDGSRDHVNGVDIVSRDLDKRDARRELVHMPSTDRNRDMQDYSDDSMDSRRSVKRRRTDTYDRPRIHVKPAIHRDGGASAWWHRAADDREVPAQHAERSRQKRYADDPLQTPSVNEYDHHFKCHTNDGSFQGVKHASRKPSQAQSTGPSRPLADRISWPSRVADDDERRRATAEARPSHPSNSSEAYYTVLVSEAQAADVLESPSRWLWVGRNDPALADVFGCRSQVEVIFIVSTLNIVAGFGSGPKYASQTAPEFILRWQAKTSIHLTRFRRTPEEVRHGEALDPQLGQYICGVLLMTSTSINKPAGLSSAQVLRDLQTHFGPSKLFSEALRVQTEKLNHESKHQWKRRSRGKKEGPKVKIGHGGTLDPLATGVLIAGIGAGTKDLGRFLECTKTYEAVVLFGVATDSYDRLGKVIGRKPYTHVTREAVEKALEKFRGKTMQRPPIFSALKMDGKKLYEYAREGKAPPREIVERPVEVLELELVEWMEPGSHPHSWPKEEAPEQEKEAAELLLSLDAPPSPKAQQRPPDPSEARKRSRSPDDGVTDTPAAKKLRDEAADTLTMFGALDPPLAGDQEQGEAGPPAAKIRMTVTSGFYVRSLCHDLGAAVDSLALMAELERSRQGDFELGRNVLAYADLEHGEDVWGPQVERMLDDWNKPASKDEDVAKEATVT